MRLEQLTSRSLARPRDLIEMTLALDAYRLAGAAPVTGAGPGAGPGPGPGPGPGR